MRNMAWAATLALPLIAAPAVQAQIELMDWHGAPGQPFFGRALAVVSDLDGDGRDDAIVGDPFGAGFAGSVHVFSTSSHATLLTFLGTEVGGEFGAAVAGLSDVNGDGVPDIAIGAPLEQVGAGRVRVFSGGNGALLFEVVGDAIGDHFGAALCATEDLNGDGIGDLLVGAPQGGGNRRGVVTLTSGVDGSTIWSRMGEAKDDYLGASLAWAGDLDGDGAPDVVAGAPQAANQLGAVHAFVGASGVPLWTATGDNPADGFGFSVAALGDVNGDGSADVAAGVPGLDAGASDAGGVAVLSGDDGGLLQLMLGDQAFGQLGFSVAGVGDGNGDGLLDVAAGDDPIEGGMVRTFSAVTGSIVDAYPVFDSTESGLGSGIHLVGGGDLDADGLPDLLVGVPTRFVSSDAGKVLALRMAFAPWVDLGAGLDGQGHAQLEGLGSLAPGTHFDLRVSGAAPNMPVTLVMGFDSLHAPFKGGTMVPAPDLMDFGLMSDALGDVDYDSKLPEMIEPGTNVLFQLWIQDASAPQGIAATNALLASVPD